MGTFAQSLTSLGVKHQVVPELAPTTSTAIPSKCLLVHDKKKQVHFVVLPQTQFGGLKKLVKDVGVKDLRFLPIESISQHGEDPVYLSPMILKFEEFAKARIHLESSLSGDGALLAFRLSEKEEYVTISASDLQAYFAALGLTDVATFSATAETADSPAVKREPKATDKTAKAETAAAKAEADKALIGLTVGKAVDFAEWYTQVITKGEMIEYYDVSGCYILRPWSFQIWERIQAFLDSSFKARGTQNAYFPSFVTKQRLGAEESHVEGFSAEVAWVTKSGQSDLAEPIAIRPTSETIMYPAYAKWIRSHRDLPLLLNQWNSVVRWEFKQPTPFIRTREFLWQEGHTAHATSEEADAFARDMLDVYAQAYEQLLAVPVCKGQKSENEKFAGGDKTYTVEGFIAANGRGLQCATSHNLGQNFSKMFGIEFEDQNREKRLVWQTSWGFTTRSIGAMIMVHGDDKGLVLPPPVAPIQVVIVPILYKDEDPTQFHSACADVEEQLKAIGVRVFTDGRTIYNPGWKYNHWELKGVPIRIEVGPRDLKNQTARIVRRFDGHKVDVPREGIAQVVQTELENIRVEMLEKARAEMNRRIVKIERFDQVMSVLNARNLLLAPWCGSDKCEEAAKEESGRLAQEDDSGMSGAMKTLCMPFEQPDLPEGTLCFRGCGPAKCYTLWGRSY
eukprot:Gregarina_sp_Pseudo_9__5765@NODE_853_length_2131_cov_18_500478_g801_i0_p1_GENE_NODE_853_length_2131_cov_18_500478_g801_i0NODE_853_length_2131_cov_18_500478_g801_i0_p1_ORF_typecomplete_len678_score222_07tRNAsynt_2b/PF00587_25/3e32ProRSC_1/PF09180_11/4_8e23HGTP_anticodon/PF03129_20/3_3e15tRNA_edit/PF04073_15/0_00067_NODE_853_length_2131_cov_18_500478_g801_i0652098